VVNSVLVIPCKEPAFVESTIFESWRAGRAKRTLALLNRRDQVFLSGPDQMCKQTFSSPGEGRPCERRKVRAVVLGRTFILLMVVRLNLMRPSAVELIAGAASQMGVPVLLHSVSLTITR
jgi:hypothetical protein